MSVLRRRKPIQEIVQEFDAFPKVQESVQEEKKTSGGIVSLLSFGLILWLVYGELMFFYDAEDQYKFLVDRSFNESLELHVDLVIAMPCNLIGADLVDAAEQSIASLDPNRPGLTMTPTKFELTPQEEAYWKVLKNKAAFMSMPGQNFKSLDQQDYVASQIVRGLQRESNRKAKQLEEEQNENIPFKGGPLGDFFMSGGIRIIASDGGILEFVHSRGGNDGTGCRIHGSVPIAKVAGNLHISPGKSLPLGGGAHAHINLFGSENDYNFSHRIERFQFGPRISGLITPLQGTEKISENNLDLYQYYLKIVPTKVFSFGSGVLSYQYSVTQLKRAISHAAGSHGMPGLNFKFDMSPVMIEVRHNRPTLWQICVRLCAVVGGVFATSIIINGFLGFLLQLFFSKQKTLLDVPYANLSSPGEIPPGVSSGESNTPTASVTFVT